MNHSRSAVSDARRFSGVSGQSAVPPVAIVLLALIAVLIGATLYLYLELSNTRTQMAEQFQRHEEQIAQLEGTVNRTSREVDTSVQEVKGIVQTAEKQITAKAQRAAASALGRTQTLEKELEQARQEQAERLRNVGGRLDELQTVATETDTRVGDLTGRVEGVSQTLTQTQQELEKTIAELKSVRGDLGVQSGLIATNGEELAALKRLGERNYYEFDIRRSRDATRVGRIQVRLRKTNEKRGNFTIDVLADDKVIQKKNKTLLEPVQFYVMGSKIPYEIVVNKIENNRIVGYLATPLENEERDASSD